MQIVEYLFLPPGPVGPAFERWGSALVGVFSGLLLGIALLYGVMRRLNGRHGLKNKVAQRILLWGGGLQLVGLALLLLRALDWPVVSMRILLFAHLLTEVGAALYLARWMRTSYPEHLTAYESEEKRRSYLPRAAGGAVEPLHRRPAAHRRP